MLGGTGRFTVTGGRSFHNRGSLVSPFRMIGADDAADSADIRTRFDKSSWMAGAEVQVNDSGPVSVNLGYRGGGRG